jgi:hypothetical protein
MENNIQMCICFKSLNGQLFMWTLKCKYAQRSQKLCWILMKTMNFLQFFCWHLKIMLVISSCAKWLIWMLKNSNKKLIDFNFGFWF